MCTLCAKLSHLSNLTGLNSREVCGSEVKEKLTVVEVPEKELWRTGLLDILMRMCDDLEKNVEDTKRVNCMLASLC